MSKYSSLISEARKPENQNASLPAPMPEEAELVNLSIKVPKALRRHWVAEAKRQDTSLTAAIVEALSTRFGAP